MLTKIKIYPEILSPLNSLKITFYGNDSEEITKRLFFDEATHKKSQNTLINMTF